MQQKSFRLRVTFSNSLETVSKLAIRPKKLFSSMFVLIPAINEKIDM